MIPKYYGTAQLQGNIRTHPKCTSHASQMCLASILDTSHVWQKRARQLIKSCCSFIARFCACTDAFCVHFGLLLHLFQMRLMFVGIPVYLVDFNFRSIPVVFTRISVHCACVCVHHVMQCQQFNMEEESQIVPKKKVVSPVWDY